MIELYDKLDTDSAAENIKEVVDKTPLMYNFNISDEHKANIYLKREDLQNVRSYKIRGAFNKISSLSTIYFSSANNLDRFFLVPVI